MTRLIICPKSTVIGVLSWTVTSLSACSIQGGLGADPDGPQELGSSELRIESLSTKPYLVTGGDVFLSVEAGEDLDIADVSVTANGRDVTAAFRPAAGGGLVGLVGSPTRWKEYDQRSGHRATGLGESRADELPDHRADYLGAAGGAVSLRDRRLQNGDW